MFLLNVSVGFSVFNSGSSFSGCVHQDKSKCLITLTTHAEKFQRFERTKFGGFNCINNRLAFDSQILLPKNEKDNYKLIDDVKINNTIQKKKMKKRITTKILKMDENNQYGNSMTKTLRYGCIKKASKIPKLSDFNPIFNDLSHTDKIGQLFMVDIKFHYKNEKTMLLMKSTSLFFKKIKLFRPINNLFFS